MGYRKCATSSYSVVSVRSVSCMYNDRMNLSVSQLHMQSFINLHGFIMKTLCSSYFNVLQLHIPMYLFVTCVYVCVCVVVYVSSGYSVFAGLCVVHCCFGAMYLLRRAHVLVLCSVIVQCLHHSKVVFGICMI